MAHARCRSARSLPLLVLIALGAAVVAAGPAQARQTNPVEVTAFGGYDFGGSFEVFDFEFGRVDIELEEGASFGAILDIPINRFFQAEVLLARQDTALEIDAGLFGEPFEITGMDIDYLHGGILWQHNIGQAKPFFVAGAGLARLNPDIPELDSETRFSFNVGGGVKTFFTPHFGLRFEGRLLVISIDEEDEVFCCDGNDDAIAQGHVAVGLIFAF